jgi:hypothetical protein
MAMKPLMASAGTVMLTARPATCHAFTAIGVWHSVAHPWLLVWSMAKTSGPMPLLVRV